MTEKTSGGATANPVHATPRDTGELIVCKVCKTIERTKPCVRCGVSYCDKEHQVAGSSVHK